MLWVGMTTYIVVCVSVLVASFCALVFDTASQHDLTLISHLLVDTTVYHIHIQCMLC